MRQHLVMEAFVCVWHYLTYEYNDYSTSTVKIDNYGPFKCDIIYAYDALYICIPQSNIDEVMGGYLDLMDFYTDSTNELLIYVKEDYMKKWIYHYEYTCQVGVFLQYSRVMTH